MAILVKYKYILEITHVSETFLPADLRFAWASVHGNTYNLRVLWDNLFMTDEPDTIKVGLSYAYCCAFGHANATADTCIIYS